MRIVFFAHPSFLGSQSMPRFVSMLAEGMQKRGHEVEIWRPEAFFSKLPLRKLKKWLGYLDQYLVFPYVVKSKLRKKDKEVLFVLSDHALGPYVPLVADRPHLIHCHDFLAQRSALGEIPENLTSASGKKYQAYIRKGYTQGRNFISVSKKTQTDLEQFLPISPLLSAVVYNGLNPSFKPQQLNQTRSLLTKRLNLDLKSGYILHVGGNQWYKNRLGVIAIYEKWRELYNVNLPLLLIGQEPSALLAERQLKSPFGRDIYFLRGIDDQTVAAAYAGATVFLFPSIAEGFGWPIAEAMASGTVVLTTSEDPMLEVAAEAAFLIPRKPTEETEAVHWAETAAAVLHAAVNMDDKDRATAIKKGLVNVERFKLEDALDNIERIYKQVLNK